MKARMLTLVPPETFILEFVTAEKTLKSRTLNGVS